MVGDGAWVIRELGLGLVVEGRGKMLRVTRSEYISESEAKYDSW